MAHIRHEFWWFMEKRADWLWDRLCPDDKVSFWLDFLPVFCTRCRYKAQNDLTR